VRTAFAALVRQNYNGFFDFASFFAIFLFFRVIFTPPADTSPPTLLWYARTCVNAPDSRPCHPATHQLHAQIVPRFYTRLVLPKHTPFHHTASNATAA